MLQNFELDYYFLELFLPPTNSFLASNLLDITQKGNTTKDPMFRRFGRLQPQRCDVV